jgi:pyrroline-5-carboxylate reductase
MRIGLIGAGNMATALALALARKLDEPLAVSDVDRGRADALAQAVSGEALDSNAAVAERSDAVILCHKPAQLDEVSADVGDRARAVISILGGTPLAAVEAAYPELPAYRFMPSIPIEVGRGVVLYAGGTRASEGPEREILDLFSAAGMTVELPESLFDAGTAVMSCAPAFFALVGEALSGAGAAHGLPAELAVRMVVETMGGTAAVLSEHGDDMPELRRRVTSPGGMTERGIAALESHGIRAAFDEAVTAAMGSSK